MRTAPPLQVLGVLALALIFTLTLSTVIGSFASVIAVTLTLFLVPAAISGGGNRAMLVEVPAIGLLVAAFVLLTAVFVATADDVRDVGYALNFAALPLAAVIYRLVMRIDHPRVGETILWLCLAGSLAGVLIAAFDVFVMGEERGHGFGGGPNLMPRIAITLGFVALAGVFVTSGRKRLLFYAGPVLAVIATLLTASRGAALALPVLAVLAFAVLLAERQTRGHALIAAALAALGAGALFLFGGEGLVGRLTGTVGTIVELFTTGETSDFPTRDRLTVLVAAWPAFLQSPLIGWGWGNMYEAIATVVPEREWLLGDNVFFHADVANFAVAGGVVGLAAWLMILAAPIAGVLSTPHDGWHRIRLYVALVLSLGFLVFGLTDFTLGYDLPTTLFAFLTALMVSAFRDGPGRSPTS